jgi:hypothetical protein
MLGVAHGVRRLTCGRTRRPSSQVASKSYTSKRSNSCSTCRRCPRPPGCTSSAANGQLLCGKTWLSADGCTDRYPGLLRQRCLLQMTRREEILRIWQVLGWCDRVYGATHIVADRFDHTLSSARVRVRTRAAAARILHRPKIFGMTLSRQ